MIGDRLETHEDVLEAARGLRFRMPGWTVEWLPGRNALPMPDRRLFDEPVVLALTCTTVDTYTYRQGDENRSDKKIKVTHRSLLPLPMPVEVLPKWFRQQVHMALMHEADEWIRVDGWMAFNPHGEPVRMLDDVRPPELLASWGYDPPYLTFDGKSF